MLTHCRSRTPPKHERVKPGEGHKVVPAATRYVVAVAAETRSTFGEIEVVRARGHRELVLLRFKEDKVAIVSGIFIALMLFGAFVDRGKRGRARVGGGLRRYRTRSGRTCCRPTGRSSRG